MFDILIKGGLIVDGSGGEPYIGDIGITGDRIDRIGQLGGAAKKIINAAGLVVTPGFIDIHTHYDGQAMWDPYLDPSFSCGVTTAIVGNCGVGFAPVRPGEQERLIELMEGVEEIPGTALHEGLDWNWNRFEEYLAELDAKPHSFDVGALMPHGPLRLYVMGNKVGTDKCASPDELREMVELVDAAMAAGAFGLSTSRTPVHRTIKGDMTPDFDVDEIELMALAKPVADHGGYFEFAPLGLTGEDFEGAKREMWIYDRIVRQTGVNLHMQMIQTNQYPDFVFKQLDWAEKINAEGNSRVYGQTGGRALGTLLSFFGINPFMDRPTFVDTARLSREERLREFSRPEIKTKILAEPNLPGHFPAFMMQNLDFCYDLGAERNDEPGPEQNLGEQARHAAQSIDAFIYDMMLETSLEPRVLMPFANYARGDFGDLHRILHSPASIICLSDAGAHVNTVCDGAVYPFMITHWARDRSRGPRIPLPRIVQMITADAASAVGIYDRGIIAAGYKADVNVFDLERLRITPPRIFHDLPGGATRLMQLGSGFHATIVSGVVTRKDDMPTGALPGRLLRHRSKRGATAPKQAKEIVAG